MIIKLSPEEIRDALAAFVQFKTGIKIAPSQVEIWHDPNDPSLDALSGVGIEVNTEIADDDSL